MRGLDSRNQYSAAARIYLREPLAPDVLAPDV